MSIFSSLNYLLTRAASAINQTGLPQDLLRNGTKFLNNIFEIVDNPSSTTNNTSYIRSQHLLLGAVTYSIETEISKSFLTSTPENSTNFNSVPTFTSNAFLELENNIVFSNEAYPNAENLLESWWNIVDPRYLRHGWGLTVTMITVYILILVVGVIGNIMVILVVLLRPQMRSVKNMFILNLAVADLFVIVFCVPPTLLVNIFAPWILGSFMCKAVAYVQGVSVCASAYSLAAISLDRCMAVYRNNERSRGLSRRTCALTVFVIWIAAMSLTIPWSVTFDVKVSEYDGLRYCVETWKNETHEKIYFLVVNLICFYAFPLMLIFVSNWIIYCHVANRHVPLQSASSAPLRKMHKDTRRHVLKMLGIVTLTFLISWLPVYILVIIIKFSGSISESEYKLLGKLMPIAQWLGTWNSSINPILYAFLHKKFRKMLKSILPAWIPVKSTRKNLGSSKTSTVATTSTEKSVRRSRATSKTNYKRHSQNTHIKSQRTANRLISRYNQDAGTVATKTIQTASSGLAAIHNVSVFSTVSKNNLGSSQRTTTENLANLLNVVTIHCLQGIILQRYIATHV